MSPINRRALLRYTGTLASTPLLCRGFRPAAAAGPDRTDFFVSDSDFFATTAVDSSSGYDTNSDGDLWPSCWADDDNVYTANGDGTGFDLDRPTEDIVMNRLYGTPETGITGDRLASGADIANIWADSTEYNRKPTGMVAIDSDGDGSDELYVAVQDLHRAPCPACFNDAPNASISKSDDHGQTWQKTDEPMFTDYRFTTIFFLDYGKSYENLDVASPETGYVYAYGLDHNWRASFNDAVPDPTNLYLARVPKLHIQNRSKWEFFAGTTTNQPVWRSDIEQREPVLHDERRVYPTVQCDTGPENMTTLSQGSVVYNEPLDRYLYTSWTEYTFEFYEAPKPWGPWRLFMRKDFGGYPWFGESNDSSCPDPKNGGYATTIPSKFISDDGTSMWVQSNWFVGVQCGASNYNFSLRRFEVEPFTRTTPSNAPNPTMNLAMIDGVTPIEKCAHYGHNEYYNDGVTYHSEDSYDCSTKPLDFWGYTWDRAYNLNRLEYTTGDMFHDGGWFDSDGTGLDVQVRQGFEWTAVSGLSITPPYPHDETAGPNTQYTLTFDDTWGDGVRIIGPPGGSASFTSIAELAVYYED